GRADAAGGRHRGCVRHRRGGAERIHPTALWRLETIRRTAGSDRLKMKVGRNTSWNGRLVMTAAHQGSARRGMDRSAGFTGSAHRPLIGLVNSQRPTSFAEPLRAFRRGLRQTGFVEDRNVGIEYRWGQGDFDRLPALTSDLVEHQVNVIAALGGAEAALMAKP